MGSPKERRQHVRYHMDGIVDTLRGAAGDDFDPEQPTELLKAAFCHSDLVGSVGTVSEATVRHSIQSQRGR